jgi:hypothetical protein
VGEQFSMSGCVAKDGRGKSVNSGMECTVWACYLYHFIKDCDWLVDSAL